MGGSGDIPQAAAKITSSKRRCTNSTIRPWRCRIGRSGSNGKNLRCTGQARQSKAKQRRSKLCILEARWTFSRSTSEMQAKLSERNNARIAHFSSLAQAHLISTALAARPVPATLSSNIQSPHRTFHNFHAVGPPHPTTSSINPPQTMVHYLVNGEDPQTMPNF